MRINHWPFQDGGCSMWSTCCVAGWPPWRIMPYGELSTGLCCWQVGHSEVAVARWTLESGGLYHRHYAQLPSLPLWPLYSWACRAGSVADWGLANINWPTFRVNAFCGVLANDTNTFILEAHFHYVHTLLPQPFLSMIFFFIVHLPLRESI